MSEQDKKIKHFIFMKFFSWQNPNYPYDVLDVDFLSKQLPIAKNALRSLENQTNKNFELIFIMNPKVFDDKKYEFIFSTLKNYSELSINFITSDKIRILFKDALKDYDFVINSGMDFDDFLYKDGIAETQSKVNECESILSYGYCKGYVYIFEELYPQLKLYEGLGQVHLLQSLIWKSSFAKNLPFFNGGNHTKIKFVLKDFLEKNGIEFQDSMFQQNTSTNAYIYFRHEFSQQKLVRGCW